MAIKTVVFWGNAPTDEKDLKLELSRLKSSGVTDGLFDIDKGRVIRSWTTVEAAQGWVDFLNSFEMSPISAEVVQD